MTTSTIRRALVGQTRFRVSLFFDDGNEVYARFGPDVPMAYSLAEAEGFAEAQLVQLGAGRTEVGHWWARIEKGTWEPVAHADDVYGRILDATFELDPNRQWTAHFIDGAVSAWEEI